MNVRLFYFHVTNYSQTSSYSHINAATDSIGFIMYIRVSVNKNMPAFKLLYPSMKCVVQKKK